MNPRVGLGILVFNEQKLLLGERKGAHGAHSFAPPGGHLEFGETFTTCAARELQEETGINVQKFEVIGFTNDIFQQEAKHYVSIFLAARYPSAQSIINKEPEKVLNWDWHALDHLPDQLFLPLANLIDSHGIDYLKRIGVTLS